MDTKRKQEIKKTAQNISRESEQFQLIHATYACQVILNKIILAAYEEQYDDLRNIIIDKTKAGENCSEYIDKKIKLESIIEQKIFPHIDVEYISTSPENARIVKLNEDFVIYLPKCLANNIFKDNDEYNYDIIHEIRKLMSHELGHLVLHIKELLQIDSTQGSKLIQNEEQEAEADYFGEQLLKLRKLRNKKIYMDGGAHKHY